jgi:hypothetical protein
LYNELQAAIHAMKLILLFFGFGFFNLRFADE